jgi:hypothetical protein
MNRLTKGLVCMNRLTMGLVCMNRLTMGLVCMNRLTMGLVCMNRNKLASECCCLPGCKARVFWWVGTKVLEETVASVFITPLFYCEDGGRRILRNIHLPNNTTPHPRLQITRRRDLYDKLIFPQLFKKFPLFYGTRRFITVTTTAYHLSLY